MTFDIFTDSEELVHLPLNHNFEISANHTCKMLTVSSVCTVTECLKSKLQLFLLLSCIKRG